MSFYEFHFVRGRKYVLKDEKRLIRREESLKYVSKGSSHFTLRVIKNEKFNEKGRNQSFFEQQIFVPTVELFEKLYIAVQCNERFYFVFNGTLPAKQK